MPIDFECITDFWAYIVKEYYFLGHKTSRYLAYTNPAGPRMRVVAIELVLGSDTSLSSNWLEHHD